MKKATDFKTLKWIFSVSGRSLWWTALYLLVRVIQSATCIVYAYALGEVVNRAQAGVKEDFLQQLVFFVGLVLVTLIQQALGRYLQEKSKVSLEKRFRVHTFSQLLRRDYGQISQIHTGDWMTRITSDTQLVANSVALIVPEITGALVRMLGAVISLFQLAPTVTAILLPCGLAMAGLSFLVRKQLKRMHKDMQKADGETRSFIQERLFSLPVVRAFTQEDTSVEMAGQRIDTYVTARMRRFRFVNIIFTLFATAVNGAQLLGIAVCGWGILTGGITYGTMSSVLYLINLLEGPLQNFSGYFSQYYSMLASAERLMEIESFQPDSAAPPHSREAVQDFYANRLDSFGLENASFAYEEGENNIVLDKVSLQIRKGEFVAFTGESGCGKSTSMKLLLSLYALQSGSTYLQSTDCSRQKLDAAWRGLFAYVPQGNQLISGTIRETLTFADPQLMTQEAQLWSALKIACADGFVAELPDGLDTMLGERGSGLSEGQMQRLSVARAIFSGRPVLLLDEATSALDASTEAQLLKNLRQLEDRTVLIITHREAALEVCDRQIHFEKAVED